MLIIVALCAGPALYAADGWDPPQYKSNLYMLSSTAPVDAEEKGFAAPTLNDNLQNFFLGIPPTQDMHGVPAYYLAYDSYEIARATVRRLYNNNGFQAPVYLYSIAGDHQWWTAYNALNAPRGLMEIDLGFRSLANYVAVEGIWLRRTSIPSTSISYSIAFSADNSPVLRLHQPSNGILPRNYLYQPTDIGYNPRLAMHVNPNTRTLVFTSASICNANQSQRYAAAVLSVPSDLCNPANIATMSLQNFAAYQLMPLLFQP
jgi:hypothetical protein